jgi:hypothetical protein
MKAARAEYMREWRKRNPGKNKEAIRRYWERKAIERIEKKNNEVTE